MRNRSEIASRPGYVLPQNSLHHCINACQLDNTPLDIRERSKFLRLRPIPKTTNTSIERLFQRWLSLLITLGQSGDALLAEITNN